MLCSNCERGVRKCNRNCPATCGKPILEQLLLGGMICGRPLLLQSVPEGLYPVGRACDRIVCEGLSHGRGHMLEQEESVRRKEQPTGAVMH